MKTSTLVNPLVLFGAGIGLALVPNTYELFVPEFSGLLDFIGAHDVVLYLWLLVAAAFTAGAMASRRSPRPPAPAPAPAPAMAVDRLQRAIQLFNAFWLFYLAVLWAFTGSIPILKLRSGFDIDAFNSSQGDANGFFGFSLVLRPVYFGLLACYFNSPGVWASNRSRCISLFLFACFVALAESKLQNFAMLLLIMAVFRLITDDAPLGRWTMIFLVVGGVVALSLGGIVNAVRSGHDITGPVDAGFDWLLRYTLFPFVNISVIVDQLGVQWAAGRCFFLYWFIPGPLRGGECSENQIFPLPVLSSPSTYMSQLYSSFGIIGLFLFTFFCGYFCMKLYRAARGSPEYRVPYALAGWALLSLSSYNHFLNPYFTYYPTLIWLIVWRYLTAAPVGHGSPSRAMLTARR